MASNTQRACTQECQCAHEVYTDACLSRSSFDLAHDLTLRGSGIAWLSRDPPLIPRKQGLGGDGGCTHGRREVREGKSVSGTLHRLTGSLNKAYQIICCAGRQDNTRPEWREFPVGSERICSQYSRSPSIFSDDLDWPPKPEVAERTCVSPLLWQTCPKAAGIYTLLPFNGILVQMRSAT